jgi:hypothetical protein
VTISSHFIQAGRGARIGKAPTFGHLKLGSLAVSIDLEHTPLDRRQRSI